MAPHILDVNLPEVSPTGAPGGDFEQIRSDPNAFGGFGAQAEKEVGAGLEKAGTTGIDLGTQLQTEVNDTHAAQLQTGYARESTDLFSQYDGLQGAAKMTALPKFKEDLGKLRDKWLAAAPSMQEKTRLAPALSGLEDRYYYYATAGASHAQTQYIAEVSKDKKDMHGGQALLSWSQGDPQGFYNEVANAAQETRNEKEAAGLDEDSIETEAKKTRGVYVREAIKMSLAQGDPHNVAEDLSEKYKGLIDPNSMVQINGLLSAHKDKRDADAVSQDAIQGTTAPGMGAPARSGVASVRNNNPGAQWPGPIATRFGATGSETIGGGNKIAKFPDPVNGAAAQFALLDERYTGLPLMAAVSKWSGGNSQQGYLSHLVQATGLTPTTVLTPQILRGPQGAALVKAMADWEAGGKSPVTEDQWAKGQQMAFGGAVQPASITSGDPSAAPSASPVEQRAATLKSSAYQAAISDPRWKTMSPEARQLTVTRINQAFTDAEIASNQDAKAKKAAVDHAAGGYITEFYDMLHSPNPDFVALAGRINHDPALADSPTEKANLIERVRKASGEEQTLTYGPGYHDARAALFSDPSAPGHIDSIGALANDDSITMAGLKDLSERLKMAKSSPDKMANEKIITSFLTDAKQQMVHDQDIGTVKIPDPKGAHLYNSEFVPRFVKQASKLQEDAEKTGDTTKLDKFLSRENVDKMINEVYPKSQRNADAISALGGALPAEVPNAPLPPAPEDVDPAGWKAVISAPPKMSTGQTATHQQYALALQTLKDNPTPEMKAKFDKWFGGKGQMADDVLGRLGGHPPRPQLGPQPVQQQSSGW